MWHVVAAVQMAESDQCLSIKTVTKLLLSAEHYTSVSPALARFYVLEAERMKKKLHLPASTASQICPYCYTIRRPDNCTRRLLPRMRTGRQVRRLERKNAGGRTVGKFRKSLLDLHSEGANRLRIRCHSCGKQTFVSGTSRPAKVSESSDLSANRHSQVQVLNKKKKRRKKNQLADSSANSTDILFGRKEVKERSLKKCRNESPLLPVCHEKRKVTNRKETQKQKHNMLQNILKQKTNTAAPDTSAALRSFLMSL